MIESPCEGCRKDCTNYKCCETFKEWLHEHWSKLKSLYNIKQKSEEEIVYGNCKTGRDGLFR